MGHSIYHSILERVSTNLAGSGFTLKVERQCSELSLQVGQQAKITLRHLNRRGPKILPCVPQTRLEVYSIANLSGEYSVPYPQP